ncbi:glycosyltransferase [Akkermansiaceae bacterium]|nr:glycosyltransferase [Akkermansiaceae bacterium]
MKVISIIIPTYNRRALLRDALGYLLDGEVPGLECVVVDDGSTDGTYEEIEEWRNRWGESRIVYLRQGKNQGAQHARNRGIAESKGDLVIFMDSDDVAITSGLADLRDFLEINPQLDFCYGKVRKTDDTLKSLKDDDDIGMSFTNTPYEIAGYHWHTMGALYRRECLELVGPWSVELTGSQDWEYQARVKLSGARGEFVDTMVGYWRQHEGERVGTKKFRPDYVRSVMIACDSILSKARQARMSDEMLERRIAKKLVAHALEWGANGFLSERKECFDQAVLSVSEKSAFTNLIRCVSVFPRVFDSSFLRLIGKASNL